MQGEVEKTYQALSACLSDPEESAWVVENRIEKGDPFFRMQIVPGKVNARSMIRLLEYKDGIARFLLQPLTGKTHQLRLHLSDLGCGILNDRLYPKLQAERADNYAAPLQLLAKMVRFRDPLSGAIREFVSGRELTAYIPVPRRLFSTIISAVRGATLPPAPVTAPSRRGLSTRNGHAPDRAGCRY